MTERTITLTEAQHLLKSLDEQTSDETLIITSQGQPCLTLMPYHTHREMQANIESLQTVLEIMLGGAAIPGQPRPEKVVSGNEKRTSWEEFKEAVGWE